MSVEFSEDLNLSLNFNIIVNIHLLPHSRIGQMLCKTIGGQDGLFLAYMGSAEESANGTFPDRTGWPWRASPGPSVRCGIAPR